MKFSEEQLQQMLKVAISNSEEYRTRTLTEVAIAEQAEAVAGLSDEPERMAENLTVWAEMQFNVLQEEASVLRGENDHQPWLSAKRAEILKEGGFWHLYSDLLSGRIPPQSFRQTDAVTDQILDSLEDPAREGQWDRRGLVMGHVQSGKTANYVALIAKAMDAGYKLVIVLAGLHNSLRAQTQARIDEGILGRDTSRGLGAASERVGVGLMAGLRPVTTLTSASENGDFKKARADAVGNPFKATGVPTVFVVKKHVSILKNLHDWLADNADRPTGHERIADFPVLIIDDEADNASIDTSKIPDEEDDEEVDPTRTNAGIRQLLNLFDQSAYVGYTATPFANIFVNDQAEHSEYGEDIFPRDFVFALRAPSNYVGPGRVFGLSDGRSSLETPGLPIVTEVDDHEGWLPPTHDASYEPGAPLPSGVDYVLPGSLEEAIRSFVLTCAARRQRGQGTEHNSMLIHVTRFVLPQNTIRDYVEAFVSDLRRLISYNNDSEEWDTLEEIWNKRHLDAARKMQDRDEPPPIVPFADIRPHVAHAVNAIVVKALNGKSSDVLDYSEHAETGLSVIAVGGAKLSRGLTLEGLSISYYLRTTKIYDTLMQMGRWFGYRPGYLDLCRLYTTEAVVDWYKNIATATEELLDDFRAMELARSRPKDFGLRVRLSTGMMITSPTRMRWGIRRRVNFGQKRPEVTTCEVDLERRELALEIMDRFLADLGADPEVHKSDRVWRGVDGRSIVKYLRELDREGLYSHSVSARPSYIAEYTERRMENGGLVEWDVLLKSPRTGKVHRLDESALEVGLATRTNRSRNPDRYSFKSLIGSADEEIGISPADIDALEERTGRRPTGSSLRQLRSPDKGLLILYLLSDEVREKDANNNTVPSLHIEPGAPFATFCVSFPRDPDPENSAVEYTVNRIYEREVPHEW